MSALSFAPATRRQVKLKIAVEGPSGAGKTLGALALAHGLAEGGKIAVIDTENGSASLYADRYQFDALELGPPYLTTKYQEAVQAAIDGGYSVVVIDNISHQWEGDGSVLQRKEETDARGGNHFSNWAPFTKEHNAFRALLLNAPLHVVATMRSKMAYTQETQGKQTKIVKVGLQPIQRDGMEYEFTLAFDVQMDHRALASKDRTGLFASELVDLLDTKVAKRLLKWLKTAAPAAPLAAEGQSPETSPSTTETERASKGPATPSTDEPTAETPWPGEGATKGKPLSAWTDKQLTWLAAEGRKGPHIGTWQALAKDELKRRQPVAAKAGDEEPPF